jgi:ACS family hexuronate transporter-like MFS transporter
VEQDYNYRYGYWHWFSWPPQSTISANIARVMAPALEIIRVDEHDYATIMVSFKIAYGIRLLFMVIIDRSEPKKLCNFVAGAFWYYVINTSRLQPDRFIVPGLALVLVNRGFPTIKIAEWFETGHLPPYFDASQRQDMAPLWLVLLFVTAQDWRSFLFRFSAHYGCTSGGRPIKSPNCRNSRRRLKYITSDSVEESNEKIPWIRLLPKRETWAFALTTVTDAVWWFYLFWGAKFLSEQFGVDIKNIGLPFLIIFILADCGSLVGGYASGALIKKAGRSTCRKITLLVCAVIILPVTFVPVVSAKWLAVFLIGFAAAGIRHGQSTATRWYPMFSQKPLLRLSELVKPLVY